MIEIVAARPTHIGPIATRMRDIDRLECLIFGDSPKTALRRGLITSTVAWTALLDGRPEAMFGAAPISTIEGRGRVWLLMTDEAVRQRRALMRLGRIYTAALHRHFPILENFVHAHNDTASRWLARLGYALGPVDVIAGAPMRGFVRFAAGR
jgi:hypothetical protein